MRLCYQITHHNLVQQMSNTLVRQADQLISGKHWSTWGSGLNCKSSGQTSSSVEYTDTHGALQVWTVSLVGRLAHQWNTLIHMGFWSDCKSSGHTSSSGEYTDTHGVMVWTVSLVGRPVHQWNTLVQHGALAWTVSLVGIPAHQWNTLIHMGLCRSEL
jgi:hypothetical protein